MRRILSSTLATALFALSVSASIVQAQGPYLTSNRLGYTGTVTRFATLGDAQSNSNALPGGPYAVPQRDLGFFIVNNNAGFSGPGYPPSAFDFLTFWYSSPSTPSNTNVGFVQIADEDGGSITSYNGVWTDNTLTQFLYTASGANTTPGCEPYYPTVPEDCPRLWNAGSPVGSAETTLGTFVSYNLSLLATGLAPATFNAVTGAYESDSDPTSVSGSFNGIFHNTSVEDPGSNGYYRVNLSINMTSWAAGQDQGSLNVPNVGYSIFGSASIAQGTVVPEPSTYALMGVGLAGLFLVARRRRGTV